MDRSILSTFSQASSTLNDIGSTMQTIGHIADGKDSLGILSIAADPAGWLMGAAIDKLVDLIINALQPLKKALDTLFGDTNAVTSFVGSLDSKSAQIKEIASSVLDAAEVALDQWEGSAAKSFEATASQLASSHQGAAGQLHIQGLLTQGVGTVTASLKETVMGIIKKFVKDAVTKALMALASSWCSFGATLAAFSAWLSATLAQTLAWVSKTFGAALKKIAEIGSFISKAAAILSKATSLFGTVMNTLDKITGGKVWDDKRNLSSSELGKLPKGYTLGLSDPTEAGKSQFSLGVGGQFVGSSASGPGAFALGAHGAGADGSFSGSGASFAMHAPQPGDFALHRSALEGAAGDPLALHYLGGTGTDHAFSLGSAYNNNADLRYICDQQFGTSAAGAEALVNAGHTNFSFTGPATQVRLGSVAGLNGSMGSLLNNSTMWVNGTVNVAGGRATLEATVNAKGTYGAENGIPRLNETGLATPFTGKGKVKKKISWNVGESPDVEGVYIDVDEADFVGNEA